MGVVGHILSVIQSANFRQRWYGYFKTNKKLIVAGAQLVRASLHTPTTCLVIKTQPFRADASKCADK
jgi:hypothetical protein